VLLGEFRIFFLLHQVIIFVINVCELLAVILLALVVLLKLFLRSSLCAHIVVVEEGGGDTDWWPGMSIIDYLTSIIDK